MTDKLNQAITDARLLLRSQHSGILSTISVSVSGYPFGSVTPFMMNGQGDIIIYASDIAQHSKNMKADNRVSLCVNDGAKDDSQASARVTIMGQAEADVVNQADIDRYYRLFPQAKAYVKAHDFRFYKISPTRVRYIGGFGEIFWFDGDIWIKRFVDIATAESGAIDHMHEDHGDALEAIANHLLNASDTKTPKMLSIFQDGFHMECQGNTHFVTFEDSLDTPEQLRHAMVQVTKKARASTVASEVS